MWQVGPGLRTTHLPKCLYPSNNTLLGDDGAKSPLET